MHTHTQALLGVLVLIRIHGFLELVHQILACHQDIGGSLVLIVVAMDHSVDRGFRGRARYQLVEIHHVIPMQYGLQWRL